MRDGYRQSDWAYEDKAFRSFRNFMESSWWCDAGPTAMGLGSAFNISTEVGKTFWTQGIKVAAKQALTNTVGLVTLGASVAQFGAAKAARGIAMGGSSRRACGELRGCIPPSDW